MKISSGAPGTKTDVKSEVKAKVETKTPNREAPLVRTISKLGDSARELSSARTVEQSSQAGRNVLKHWVSMACKLVWQGLTSCFRA